MRVCLYGPLSAQLQCCPSCILASQRQMDAIPHTPLFTCECAQAAAVLPCICRCCIEPHVVPPTCLDNRSYCGHMPSILRPMSVPTSSVSWRRGRQSCLRWPQLRRPQMRAPGLTGLCWSAAVITTSQQGSKHCACCCCLTVQDRDTHTAACHMTHVSHELLYCIVCV